MSKKNIGSSFDDLLKEDGIYEETHDVAVKRVLAWQIAQAMKEQRISKTKMAERMKTSRTQIERLLDPKNNSVQLDTLQRAAHIVGRRLVIQLEARPDIDTRRCGTQEWWPRLISRAVAGATCGRARFPSGPPRPSRRRCPPY